GVYAHLKSGRQTYQEAPASNATTADLWCFTHGHVSSMGTERSDAHDKADSGRNPEAALTCCTSSAKNVKRYVPAWNASTGPNAGKVPCTLVTISTHTCIASAISALTR